MKSKNKKDCPAPRWIVEARWHGKGKNAGCKLNSRETAIRRIKYALNHGAWKVSITDTQSVI